ncbi:MAG: septal ring lytic transglycosylase RlpA family protein [Methylotenera sp.]|nr:septal ring lytic transglycosylase RlpA family protein [Methylotenera sp.]
MLNLQLVTLRKYTVLLSIVLLAACGGGTAIKSSPKQPSTESTASPASKSGTGGYYLDDGPGENAPADIDSIPGATLKTEQPSSRANKPYVALGQQYTPMTSYTPYKKQGVASWYGKRYHGRKTSTGEIYDMYAMSAAHTVLPIPSYAKVTNPANGRSVVVRVNDRGPFKNDRLIDLSYAAAYQLRLIQQGSGLVEVETIDTSAEALRKASNNTPEQRATLLASSTPEDSAADNLTVTARYYVQAGAFQNKVNGEMLQKKIQALELAENVGVANVYNNGLYRVKLGPYSSKKEADISAAEIRRQLNIATLTTNQ